MTDLNQVILLGRVTKDAELISTKNGKKIANFSIANNYSYKNENDEWITNAYFFPLTLYGLYAERMQPKIKKGYLVLVTGKLRHETWESEGKKHSNLAITVNAIRIIRNSGTTENEVFEDSIDDYESQQFSDEVYINNLNIDEN